MIKSLILLMISVALAACGTAPVQIKDAETGRTETYQASGSSAVKISRMQMAQVVCAGESQTQYKVGSVTQADGSVIEFHAPVSERAAIANSKAACLSAAMKTPGMVLANQFTSALKVIGDVAKVGILGYGIVKALNNAGNRISLDGSDNAVINTGKIGGDMNVSPDFSSTTEVFEPGVLGVEDVAPEL